MFCDEEFSGGCMNLKQFWGIVLALLVVLSMGSSRLAAQTTTTGDIAGVVTDPSNAVVPDAKVTIRDNTKGTVQETKTNKDGAYHFYLLSPNPYTIAVTVAGFETTTRQITVALGQIGTADVQLTLGASTQTVTVTEAAPLIQTENGDTTTSLSAQQVANIPNPGNDLTAIAQLAPGVVTSPVGGPGGNMEAFGLPATSNLFTLNGMDDNDPFLNVNNSGSSNQLLGTNEVQEADVVTNGYTSSYGTLAGINVNFITKSGGNDFHGNAVYYWNGRAMNANDWFNNDNGLPRAFDNANQWAASIGGPIKKDKLFFFLNTEGLRVLIPVPSTIFVPTTAFETAVVNNLTTLGDTASIPYYCQNLAGICPGSPAANAKDGAGIFNLFNGAQNQANAQNNLPPGQVLLENGDIGQTGNGCSNFTGLGVIDTGVLAAGRMAPSAVRSRPAGVGTGSTVTCAQSIREVPVNFAPEKQIAGRTDWNIGQNDRAYLRMAYDEGDQPSFTDPVNPIFNATSIQPQYQGQLNETHIFGPTLSNQFILAVNWYTAIFQQTNPSAALAAFPTTLALGDSSLGGPAACGVGLACDNFIWPQGRNVTQFQLGDDVSKSLGNHTLKFGAKYHKNYVSDHDFGAFSVGLEVPFSLADFANGGDPKGPGAVGSELLQSFPVSLNQPVRLYEVAGYIQDEWKIKSNLTITPALRLEHASNPTCVTDCFSQLGVPFENIGTVQPYNQLIQINRREALLGYQNLQWEPRISFAWQPFGAATGRWKSDFVIRGGAGLFYDIFPGAISDSLAQNAPLFDTFTILSANSGAPGATCPGFLSPNQNAGSNLFACSSSAQAGFLNAFNSGASVTASNPNITFTQPKTEAPQYQKWSLEIQKGFGPNDSINVGYYGNHGIHLPVFDNSLNAFGFGSLPLAPASTQFGEVQGVISEGISNYNGIVASYKHRFSGWAGSGVVQINYTFSHAFDDISNGGLSGFSARSILNPQNPFDLGNMYGPSDYDVRHQVNGNYVWQLPIRRALMGHGWAPLVDGWQVSGAIFYHTGLPFTVTDGAESVGLNGNNYFASIIPNLINAVPTNCSSESIAGATAKTTCFGPALTAPNNFGNGAGGIGSETEFGIQGLRNKFRGPGYVDSDFSFTKNTKIPGWERGSLGIGLQFFNLFNHANFNLPISDISNGQFGTIQSAISPPTSILGSFLGGDASPRLIQVKAQLTF
jgi:hypothetical protein